MFLSPEREIEWIYSGNKEMYLKEPIEKIDDEVSVAEDFWQACEVNCVAECCGLEAFCFYEETILDALKMSNNEKILKMIESIVSKMAESKCQLYSSSRLNQVFPRNDLFELMSHIEKIIKSTCQSTQCR